MKSFGGNTHQRLFAKFRIGNILRPLFPLLQVLMGKWLQLQNHFSCQRY
jgi:hypothetical protein